MGVNRSVIAKFLIKAINREFIKKRDTAFSRFRHSGDPARTALRIMDKQIAELEGKLKTLNFRLKKTGNVSKKDDRTAFEKHKVSIEALVMAVVKLKKSIEEQKFANCEDDQAVLEWANEIEKVVNEGDACIRELAERIEQIDRNLKHATVLYEHKREVELEKEKIVQQQEAINRAHAEELEFEKKKFKLKQARTEPPENVHV